MGGPGLGGFVAAHKAQYSSVSNTEIEIKIVNVE
jgi:hypothetical protein